MTGDHGRRMELSKISNYPDIDLGQMLRAISLARAISQPAKLLEAT